MNRRLLFLLFALLSALAPSCTMAPGPEYADTPYCKELREEMYQRLMKMLPPAQQQNAAAQEEARWLADNLHKGAAAVARVNDPALASWFNNRLVNSTRNVRERGLCWHYQHDLYRELRRRPLHFFRIGCCVMDSGKSGEHHCIYICERSHSWQDGVVVCAWWNSGKIKIWSKEMLAERECEDEPAVAAFLNRTYPEGHRYPIEHWARIKKDGGGMSDYIDSNLPEAVNTHQGRLMLRNMAKGAIERGGKPTDY